MLIPAPPAHSPCGSDAPLPWRPDTGFPGRRKRHCRGGGRRAWCNPRAHHPPTALLHGQGTEAQEGSGRLKARTPSRLLSKQGLELSPRRPGQPSAAAAWTGRAAEAGVPTRRLGHWVQAAGLFPCWGCPFQGDRCCLYMALTVFRCHSKCFACCSSLTLRMIL